jgi:DNA (cytosine-5)-methyltransferase 1
VSRPRLLDLFCGAGGAAMGYHRAGFDVVGVDLEPQPHYPFEFVQGDALLELEMGIVAGGWPGEGFDAIHASPPCQAYSTMGNRWESPTSPPLIAETRDLLEATELPWVIENVSGALADMRSPIELTGEMFGLGVHRPRLFESNVMLLAPPRPPRQKDPVAVYGKNDGRRLWTRKDGSELRCASLEEAQEAMGMDWADWHGTKEAIPPAYTQHVGAQLLFQLKVAT